MQAAATTATGRHQNRSDHGSNVTSNCGSDYGEHLPASSRIHVEGPHGIPGPMRDIFLSGGEPALRVYDASLPRGHELPELARDPNHGDALANHPRTNKLGPV